MWKKIVAGILIVAIVLFAIFGFLAFYTSPEYSVQREVTIDKSPEEVFAYVKLLKNQNEWGPWFKKEPTMQQEFRGTDGQPGFVAAWKGGSESGSGEQEIKRVVQDRRIETELRFKEPFEAVSNGFLTTEPAGEGKTKVVWGVNGSVPRPMNVLLLAFNMEQAMGKDFEEGLANLKTIMESK